MEDSLRLFLMVFQKNALHTYKNMDIIQLQPSFRKLSAGHLKTGKKPGFRYLEWNSRERNLSPEDTYPFTRYFPLPCPVTGSMISRDSSFLISDVAVVGLQPVSSITFETRKNSVFLKLS